VYRLSPADKAFACSAVYVVFAIKLFLIYLFIKAIIAKVRASCKRFFPLNAVYNPLYLLVDILVQLAAQNI